MNESDRLTSKALDEKTGKHLRTAAISITLPPLVSLIDCDTHWGLTYLERSVTRVLKKAPHLVVIPAQGQFTVKYHESYKALGNTLLAVFRNAFEDIQNGYSVKLRAYYRHFPFTLVVKKDRVQLHNFVGYKSPVFVKKPANVSVKVTDDGYLVESFCRVAAGNFAHLLTTMRSRIKKHRLDRRVFVDTLYRVDVD